jgi:hypothetical protein
VEACPRCGTRLLPGALACINCDLPIPPSPQPGPAAVAPPAALPSNPPSDPPPYGAPPPYSPYPPGAWPPYGAPQQPYPGPGYPGGPPGPAPWTTNGLSVAGLILSILWLGGLGSVLAVIFGHVSRSQIRKRPQRGHGLSTAALIIGYLGIAGSIAFYASLPSIINSNPVQNVIVQQDMRSAADAERHNLSTHGTYTNNAVDLQNAGFTPTPFGHNTILVAYKNGSGFCLLGARTGSTSWYLYDSNLDDVSDVAYPSREAAAANCTVTGLNTYVTIA